LTFASRPIGKPIALDGVGCGCLFSANEFAQQSLQPDGAGCLE
jgi:hypothetical protein